MCKVLFTCSSMDLPPIAKGFCSHLMGGCLIALQVILERGQLATLKQNVMVVTHAHEAFASHVGNPSHHGDRYSQ